jgi:hypothetical protein
MVDIMKYHSSSQEVKVGDKVRFAGRLGAIVFLVNEDVYSEKYPREHWSFLEDGFGVEIEEPGDWQGALFVLHSSEEEEDLKLVGHS